MYAAPSLAESSLMGPRQPWEDCLTTVQTLHWSDWLARLLLVSPVVEVTSLCSRFALQTNNV